MVVWGGGVFREGRESNGRPFASPVCRSANALGNVPERDTYYHICIFVWTPIEKQMLMSDECWLDFLGKFAGKCFAVCFCQTYPGSCLIFHFSGRSAEVVPLTGNIFLEEVCV